MVVLLLLDKEDLKPEARIRTIEKLSCGGDQYQFSSTVTKDDIKDTERQLSNYNGFAAALACYPIVTQLAHSLDLNSLHALSCTCHQFRGCLLQFRKQLMSRSLRCSNELSEHINPDNGFRPLGYQSWDVSGSFGISPLRITSGKLGPCARDMVGDCRRCGRVVCRNCISKSPPLSKLTSRHRRLCSTCIRAPLSFLIKFRLHPSLLPTSPAAGPCFSRDCCSCDDTFFVCQPCGHAISSADINYKRIWEWRTRYSTYLGGLGTGIGEGNEGVKCGKGIECLAAEDTEVETDCGSEELSSLSWTTIETGDGEDGTQYEAIGETGEKAGYLRQEIEGIGGGVIRTKIKRRVRVGRTVEEHEDERERAEYLAREARGESRSWCGWCNRVIPAREEAASIRT